MTEIVAAHLERVARAAENADWDQVVLNGGPPCFHLYEQGSFCLRAKRWAGHANGVAKGNRDGAAHEFVSFAEFLAAVLAACAREAEKPLLALLEEAEDHLGGIDSAGPNELLHKIRAALERAVGEKASLDPPRGQHGS